MIAYSSARTSVLSTYVLSTFVLLFQNTHLQVHVTCLDQSTFYVQILSIKTRSYVGFSCKRSLPFPSPQSPYPMFLPPPSPFPPSLWRLLRRLTVHRGGSRAFRLFALGTSIFGKKWPRKGICDPKDFFTVFFS